MAGTIAGILTWVVWWTGLAVLTFLAAGLVCMLVAWVTDKAWRIWTRSMGMSNLIEAVREWRLNHPDKWEKQKHRQGDSDG